MSLDHNLPDDELRAKRRLDDSFQDYLDERDQHQKELQMLVRVCTQHDAKFKMRTEKLMTGTHNYVCGVLTFIERDLCPYSGYKVSSCELIYCDFKDGTH